VRDLEGGHRGPPGQRPVQFVVTAKEQVPGGRGAVESRRRRGDGIAARSSVGSGGVPYRQWSDLDLVACLADESGDAYAELYRRHSVSVMAAARMILVRDNRCEDVVAEVFVALWFFPEKFDPSRGSLLAFLRLKARGRSIDIVRTETARRRRDHAEIDAVSEPRNDADAVVIGAESALAVRSALALLPLIEREPIYLAFFRGLAYKEVAVRLDLPEGTVKGRIRSGLSRLQADDSLHRLRQNADDVAVDGRGHSTRLPVDDQ
jgi:RNA polymerase sigma-70 factor (ECF subfamily)